MMQSLIPAPQYLNSQEKHYRIYSESEFKPALEKQIQDIAKQRADRQLQPNAQLILYIIASKTQRRLEIEALLPQIPPHLCIRVVGELFPFDFHSYRFRGKTCVGVIVDNLIADEFFAGFPKPFEDNPAVITNHQHTINLSLSTVCFNSRDKEYKDFYFIV